MEWLIAYNHEQMQVTINSQAHECEQLCARLNNGEVQLRATEQWLGDTEARMINICHVFFSLLSQQHSVDRWHHLPTRRWPNFSRRKTT